VLVAAPMYTLVFLIGPFLYPLVFGQEWAIAGEVAKYYAVAAALSFLSVPFDRAGIIVNAWWYGPSWHLGRLLTTLAVMYLSQVLEATFFEFLFWLVLQSSALYMIDATASFLFSRRTLPFSSQLRT
jgi:O-antigen/teichoic acid export membrane protein